MKILFLNHKNKTPITVEMLEIIAHKHNLIYQTEPISISYTNDVFLVEKKNKSFYLKIFTDQWCDNDAGLQEIKLTHKVRQKRISTPKAINFVKADNKVPRNYALFEKLEGEQLCNKTDSNCYNLIEKILHIINKFQTIKGKSGFFLHNPKIHNTFSNHKEFLEDIMTCGYSHLTKRNLNHGELKNLFKIWNPPLEREYFGLCHNDYTPKHILVKENKITGVLDFEWSYFGQIESDYAQWLVTAGINGFESSVDKSFNLITKKCNSELLSYYSARQLLIAGVWTHQNVEQPFYTDTCLEKATKITQKRSVTPEDYIWSKGSPIK